MNNIECHHNIQKIRKNNPESKHYLDQLFGIIFREADETRRMSMRF